MKSHHAAVLALALVAGSVAAGHAQQSTYPVRNVTIVNPTLAGSTTDGLARALSVGLSNRLGQQFVVSNQAGGAGAIGTATVARAPQDGYTLLFGAVYVLSVLPVLRPAEVGYRSNSLVPVCQTVSNAMVLVVRPEFAVQVACRPRRRRARRARQDHLWAPGARLDPEPGHRGIPADRQSAHQPGAVPG